MRRFMPILALAVLSCQPLEVTNPNQPDRLRATQQPTAAESFVATAFRTWWPVGGHDDYPSWALSTIAWEITSGFADYNIWLFVLFSVIARGGRFFIVAILLNRYGTWIRETIEKRLGLWVALGTGVLVIGFVIAFRMF